VLRPETGEQEARSRALQLVSCLERLLDCPFEQLEFHFWYLKEKGWIKATEDGTLAITVDGGDRVQAEHDRSTTKKLLADQRASRV